MKYIGLSLEELKAQSNDWAQVIELKYKPDLIIYVAKAGFLIAYEFSKRMKVPMIGIETVREKGSRIKDYAAPIVRKMPDFIRNLLITAELKSGIHKRNNKRNVRFLDNCSDEQYKSVQKILVVDDSVDTGASIVAVNQHIKRQFPNADIKTAGFNVWDSSKKLVVIDFILYKNTVIKTPMSKDSEEHLKFIQEYKNHQSKRK